jgi:hypothetical protein
MHAHLQENFARIFATIPSVPKAATSLNDDDFYVIDLTRRSIVSSFGSASATAQVARSQGVPLKAGQALMRGMQLRYSGLIDEVKP